MIKKSVVRVGGKMSELVFAMELHGQAAPVEGREGVLQAQTVGRGPTGETVTFTSEVVIERRSPKLDGSSTAVGVPCSSTPSGLDTLVPAQCLRSSGA